MNRWAIAAAIALAFNLLMSLWAAWPREVPAATRQLNLADMPSGVPANEWTDLNQAAKRVILLGESGQGPQEWWTFTCTGSRRWVAGEDQYCVADPGWNRP